MLFVEPRFLPFFLLVFAVHWLMPWNRARKVWLLVASYVFYAAWDWRFLSLILFSTATDYVVGWRLGVPGARRRAWLAVSVVVNIGLLAVFKYLGFFVESAASLLQLLGLHPHLPTLSIVLPVGISFYTFQTLSYSIDVYRGRLRPVLDPLDLSLFVAFFPQLVAGPIVRAVDFLPQLRSRRYLARVDVRGALVLFLIGFVKKACISDNVAAIVDPFFAHPGRYDALGAWNGVLYYAVQIYCDFSGYSDMAIACAALLGYRLCLNFHYPYFATNIADFWRRWHISLSSWLRDYVYIPLGGNRGSRGRVHLNLTITLVLCGLWHGAAWNFVLFGFLHAVAVIARIELRARLGEEAPVRRLFSALGLPLTFWFFVATLIVFRAKSAEAAWTAARSFLLLDAPGARDFGTAFLWIIPALALLHWASYRGLSTTWWRRVPAPVFAPGLGAAFALALAFVSPATQPFIYFQF